MLYPSDPSCSSSRVSAIRSDERISGPDPAVASLGEAHIPKFSIRDYVSASRSKDSWPFPRWLLDLCLKHGVEDLLPPFEPPSAVRRRCHQGIAAKAERIIASCPQVEDFFLLDGQHNLTRTVSCLPSAKEEGHYSSDQQVKTDNLISGEPATKKCRLILPGVISETNRSEEISSTSIASDSMALKVCPVCKAFSSTSNTTLNAHMDQCLSMASDATMTVDETARLKIKPRKKRLMDDIYASALSCSLEDLDRRNGTSWATTLNLVPSSHEATTEAKKLDLSQIDTKDDKCEGAVYVDSNGIKLRILSKFNSSCQELPRELLLKPKKNNRHVGDEEIIVVSKKKHFGEKRSKKLKLKVKNKKLRSLKLFKSEVPETAIHEDLQGKGSVQLSCELDQAQGSLEVVTLQRWPSSKRSGIAKKYCKKDLSKKLKQSELVTQMKKLEPRLPASITYSSVKRHREYSQSQEPKMADFTSSTVQNKENVRKNSQGCLSESTSNKIIHYEVSRNSRNDEFYLERKHKLHDPPLKTIRLSTLTESNSSSKKIGKHRSILRFTRRKIDFPCNSNGEQQRNADDAVTGFVNQELLNLKISRCKESQPSCSMTVNSLNGEGTGLPPASDDIISPMKAYGMGLEQLLLDKLDDQSPDKSECRYAESEAGGSCTESSACLTSHGDVEPDIQRENFSLASDPLDPNQKSNLGFNMEPSESPSVDPLSLKHSHSNPSDREIGHNHQFQMDLTVDRPLQHSGYHHCCCSWKNLMTVTMQTLKAKDFSNLCIKPSIPSSFCSYSSLHTETAHTTSLESPNSSMVTRACNTTVGSTSPSCGTPSPSGSNSILRLMGKDLMISHNEEPSNLPSPSKVNNSSFQSYPSPLRFPSCAADSLTVRSPVPPMTDMQACSHLQTTMNHNAYTSNNIMGINGSVDDDMVMRGSLFPVPHSHTMFQRISPYFAPHNLPVKNHYKIGEGSALEVPAPLLPRPYMLTPPSATHFIPPFYFPQSLR